jgi:hypothetical protein
LAPVLRSGEPYWDEPKDALPDLENRFLYTKTLPTMERETYVGLLSSNVGRNVQAGVDFDFYFHVRTGRDSCATQIDRHDDLLQLVVVQVFLLQFLP